MNTTKTAAICFGSIGCVTGLYAAHLWQKASRVPVSPQWGDFEPLETEDKAIDWALAAATAMSDSAVLNKKAAQWTAVAVLMNAIAGILGVFLMKRVVSLVLLFLVVPVFASPSDEVPHKHVYLCRSPALAFDFWRSLQEVREKGITLTPQIAAQICDNMKAGSAPQCIRVEADQVKPVAAGWGGAMAVTDGKTRVWFHNPDDGGWMHPDYYVEFVNSK